MVALPVLKQIQSKLDLLTDEQLAELLRYIEVMQSSVLPGDYDEDNDPSVGFFSASPDYAARSKEVLQTEFGMQKRSNMKANE
jgi:hypothetical protein